MDKNWVSKENEIKCLIIIKYYKLDTIVRSVAFISRKQDSTTITFFAPCRKIQYLTSILQFLPTNFVFL